MNTPDQKTISPVLAKEVITFFTDHPPKRLSRNLRRVLLDFLRDQLQTGTPLFLDDLLWDMYYLFDLLDVAAIETRTWQRKKEFQPEDLHDDNEGTNSSEPVSSTLESSDNGLSAFINFIAISIKPEKIFLLSPRPEAPEKPGYIDLLVVMPDTSQTSFTEYETVIRLGSINHTDVNFSIHQSAFIAKQISEGHVFYSLACSQSNLVFDNKKTPLPVPPSEKSAAIKEKAIEEFTAGFTRAQSFLAASKHHMGRGESEMAAFMLHQAAELTFRAVAISLMGYYTRTHSLDTLKKTCRRCAPQLSAVFPADNEYEQQLLKLLDNAYRETRYARKYEVSKEQLVILCERVGSLQMMAKEIFDEKINGF